MTVVTASEFNQRPSQIKAMSLREPVFVTERGRPTAVVLSMAAFIRLMMNPVTFGDGLGLSAAAAIELLRGVKAWAGERCAFVGDDTSLAAPVLDHEALERGLMGYRQVTDFHLLNLAGRYGARLTTLDQRLRPCSPREFGALVEVIDVG